MIEYNSRMAQAQSDYMSVCNDKRVQKTGDSYAFSYAKNAELMTQGIKPLTYRRINELTRQSTSQ